MAFLDLFGGKRTATAETARQWDAAVAATRGSAAHNRPRPRVATVPRANATLAASQNFASQSSVGAASDMVTRQIVSQQYDQQGQLANPQFDNARTVAGAILQRWPLLLMSMLTSLLLALLFLLLVTPRYISTAKILLDSQPKRVVDGAVVQSGLGSSAAGADTLLVDSQVELIQSATVLRRIIETEKLKDDPEFAVPHGAGFRILLRNTLGYKMFGNERERPPETNPDDIALWRFTDKHLRVRRDGNTYAIQIGVMSENPAKAARLANAVAQAYVKEGVQSATDTTRAATGDLDSRITDLRNRVQKAENDVEAWRTKNGLIGVPGLLLTEQQMSQLNDKLGLARAASAIAKARYDQVKDLSSRSGGAALGAQSDALKSNVITNLRQSLSRIERQEAVIQQTLRPGHPDYAKAATERRSVLAQLDDELNRIKANAKAEFELSVANEKATADELKLAEGKTTLGNQAQVRLRELQRTLESERAVYQQFLNRANETREQADLNRPMSRIISPATVAPFPSFPPTMLTILGSLGGGLLLGAALAWLQHLNSGSQAAAMGPAQFAPDPEPTERRLERRQAAAWTNQTAPRDANVRIQQAQTLDEDAEDAAMGAPPRRNWPRHAVSTRRSSELRASLAGSTSASRLSVRMRANAGPAEALTMESPSAARAMLPNTSPAPKFSTADHVDRFALPSPGSFTRITFTDHLAAVESARPMAQAGYRTAIDQLLAALAKSATADVPLMTLVAGTDVGVGASSTALSLAYRAANTGTRTLLIDACSTDAHLSHRLARSQVQNQPGALDNVEDLAAITMQDGRTGLALLPLAFTDLANFDDTQQTRLLSGLRQLAERYELVLIDVGAASTNRGGIFLGSLAERMLIVTHTSVADPLLTAANFSVNKSRATVVTTPTR
jgi:uncharacterized protein involved in exopolysaccharide biosynthesis/Mrp family chromosome partitioning ATPase